jgi:hypothetical protein
MPFSSGISGYERPTALAIGIAKPIYKKHRPILVVILYFAFPWLFICTAVLSAFPKLI